MYEINKVYIWQNQVGEYAVLNGTETTVVAGPFPPEEGKDKVWWETDTIPPGKVNLEHDFMEAWVGDLRLKDPPSGQSKIFEMFKKQTELEVM